MSNWSIRSQESCTPVFLGIGTCLCVSINGKWPMVPTLELCPLEVGDAIWGVLDGLSQVDGGTGRSFGGDVSQTHGCHSDSVWGHGCFRSYITGASKDWPGEVDRGYPPTRGA